MNRLAHSIKIVPDGGVIRSKKIQRETMTQGERRKKGRKEKEEEERSQDDPQELHIVAEVTGLLALRCWTRVSILAFVFMLHYKFKVSLAR